MVTRSDSDIQQDVLAELDWDPEVDATEVGVEVDDGVVTLTGWVDSYSKKLAAERAALRVDGVRAVVNNISVKTIGTRTDTDIAREVAEALETNSAIPRDAIKVTVQNGKVTLTGEVPWEYQRAAAAAAIRYIPGVRDVINLITIKQPRVSPEEIKEQIERALVRDAQLDAERIQVHIENGTVRLTGTVRSWHEKMAAADAAWRAKGVTRVINDIEVRPV